jgi:excisionase family DNA binding protein
LDTQNTLLTVQELAELLKLKPSWVYEHADDLGAYRLGKYVRFSLPRVMQRLEGADCPPMGPQLDDQG